MRAQPFAALAGIFEFAHFPIAVMMSPFLATHMWRATMRRTALVLFLAFASAVCAVARGAEPERPNVVVIMADDMGYSDLGCFGGEIRTPHLDRLAAGGLRFTNFYSENMCWVSRAALLTGIYHRTSMVGGAIHSRCVTLAEALRSSGYTTLMSGKWHLAGRENTVYPADRGFDRFYGILGGAASYFAPYSLTRDRKNAEAEYQRPGYYITQAITDNAVDFVEKAEKTRPLFLYVAYTAAHWPLHALPDDIAAYKGRYASGWDAVREKRLERMKAMGIVDSGTPLSPRHPDVPPWRDAPDQEWQQRRMEVYAAQVTAMDRGIGEVVAALERTGRLDNTLLFFTIDNGGCHVEYGPTRKGVHLPEKTRDGRPVVPGNLPHILPGPEDTYQSYGYGWANASNTPLRLFKQFDHEGGIRTPMIAHWPKGITGKGRIVGTVAHLIDILPTVQAATGTDLPQKIGGRSRIELDGLSLLPALKGKRQPQHASLFFHHARGKAIRYGRWKLVQQRRESWELYDMESDPNELRDLASTHTERVKELEKRWTAWRDEQIRRRATLPAPKGTSR